MNLDLGSLGWAWATSAQAPELADEYYCERQDRFTTRLERMGRTLERSLGAEAATLASLLTLVAGEIGDNSFAHNVASWPDVPGIFFAPDPMKRRIILADRGRGVRATLRRVREIPTDSEALRIAFTEVISGRDPEKRGNGLKVVRGIAEQQPIGLTFRSGLAQVTIPKQPGPMRIAQTKENIRGALAVVTY